MTTVKWTTNPQKESTPFKNQSYFKNFNWDGVEAGDIIWLEDYKGNDILNYLICGIIARFDFNNPIIRVLPHKEAKLLANLDARSSEPLDSIIGLNYFEKFMYH